MGEDHVAGALGAGKPGAGSLLTAQRLPDLVPGPLLFPVFAVWLWLAVVRSAQCPHNSQVA